MCMQHVLFLEWVSRFRSGTRQGERAQHFLGSEERHAQTEEKGWKLEQE